MALTPEQIDLYTKGGSGNATIAMRIGTPVPEYLWFGDGDFQADESDPFSPGAIHNGCGLLREMPPLQAMRNGQADVIDFTFVGPRAIPSNWYTDPTGSGISRARVNLGLIGFDRNLQPLGGIAWFWPGRVGYIGARGGPDGRVVTISVYNGKIERARAHLRRWSNASHLSRHPGDRVCERTDLYRRLSLVTWPQ